MHPEHEGPGGSAARDRRLSAAARRARPEARHELDAALERKGSARRCARRCSPGVEGWGYVDDARFARERAASLLRKGGWAPRPCSSAWRPTGWTEEARQALAQATGAVAFDALAAARQVLERPGAARPAADPKEQARAGRLLHSRGFSEDVIQRLLGEPSLDPSGPDD